MNREPIDIAQITRKEVVYGQRVERCFIQRPHSLYELLANAAAAHPNELALTCETERLNWQQLYDLVSRMAQGMQVQGIRPGDRVALLLGNCIELVIALFAAARIGAISVPMNVREQVPGITYMLNRCGAKLLIHESEETCHLPKLSATPELRWRWQIGPEPLARDSSTWSSHIAEKPSSVISVNEQDTAVILYTSGTTGRPKGAMLTHLGIVHSSMHFATAMKLGSQDCTIAAVPLSHVTGLVALVTTFTLCCGKLVIQREFKADKFLRLAIAENMTHSLMVPAMYKLCLLDRSFESDALTHWRIGGYGGASMPLAIIKELAIRLPALELMNCYGATETTSPATLIPRGDRSHPDSVGKALPCAKICVMDDDGRELPSGETGEIWIKGPMVVPGYWDNPQASGDAIVGGWWRSGDLGSIDAQGYVRVFDRKKDMINRGGYKIYSLEVENVLYEHPAVREAAVVPRPCPILGERVHAWVSLRESANEKELKEHCAARLADYKVPESFTILTTPLPRNANGKLLKREMHDRLIQELTNTQR